jgi:GntR family transcriptional regulator, transcriptional repressor for pyruvate dehydrogenase complex
MNPQFRPARPVRAYEAIVRQIEEAVFRGDLQPGQRLPSEKELMRQFEVSRSTIREALRVLENAGFIKTHHGSPNGGATVQEFSTDSLQKSLLALMSHTHKISLLELLQFRVVIESVTTSLVAILRTDEQLNLLKAAHQAMETLISDETVDAFKEADIAFHRLIADSAKNELFRICHQVALDVMTDVLGEKLWASENRQAVMREIYQRHARILQAIQARDGKTASILAKRDLIEYYGPYFSEQERSRLTMLVES